MRKKVLRGVPATKVLRGDILNRPTGDGVWLILTTPKVVTTYFGIGVTASFLEWRAGTFTFYDDEHLGTANRFTVQRYE